MLDLSRITIPLERCGGWVGQPLDRAYFALHLKESRGRLSYRLWKFHVGGCWYGGKWWSLTAAASQN